MYWSDDMEIRLEDIVKNYSRGRREFTVLDKVSFDIPAGRFTLITGDSGIGKSTLLGIIAGLIRPTSGKVFYDDKEITVSNDDELSKIRNAHLGIVTQESDLIPYLTLEDNIRLTYEINNRGKVLDDSSFDEVLNALGLSELKSSYPSEMSGGEIKRAAVARALLIDPEVIIMDEPTANLDRKNVRNVLRLLRMYSDKGSTVIISSHEEEAAAFADVIKDLEREAV